MVNILLFTCLYFYFLILLKMVQKVQFECILKNQKTYLLMKEKIMFCRNCGKNISDEAKFCCYCGEVVDGEEEKETFKVESNLAPVNDEQMPEAKETPALVIAGFILAFIQPLIGLILSIVGFNELKKDNNTNTGLCKAGIIISAISLALPIVFGIITFVIVIILIGVAPEVIDEIIRALEEMIIMICTII